jgi:HrpA-like RNA helicase
MAKRPTLLEAGSLRLADGTSPPETPIAFITAWIRKRMPEFGWRGAEMAARVAIVKAETGSGKSTVLPVGVFRLLRSGDTAERQRFHGAGVVCTQPRVLTAMALAADVDRAHSPWNPDMVLGETVGFQTGPISNRPPAGLIFATAGVLAAQLRAMEDADLMDRYRVIIVDEAHERSLDSDMLLMSLRNFYARNVGNERLPFLLLASATIEPARYAAYFGVGPDNVFEVVGRSYPIATHWPATGCNDYPSAAAETALRIHAAGADDAPGRGDILIFVPGIQETTAVVAALTRLNPEAAPMLILSINREVINSHGADYGLLFAPLDRLPDVNGARPTRRCIVSTVVAETGLTIDTLRYVIDCGWNRAREVYQPWGVEGLTTRPAARSRVAQRRGRVGRLFPGDFYPLYTENVYNALDAQQLPEMVLAGPAAVFLALVREQQRQKRAMGNGAALEDTTFRYADLGLLDPPPPEAFIDANSTATQLGFVSLRAGGLTKIGEVAAAFQRVSMEGIRTLMAGAVFGAAAPDLITCVAMFGVPVETLYADPRAAMPGAEALRVAFPLLVTKRGGSVVGVLPPSELESAYLRIKLAVADEFAEAVCLFDAFAARLDQSRGDVDAVAAWCASAGLSYDALIELARRRDEVAGEMVAAGLDPLRAADARLSAAPAPEPVAIVGPARDTAGRADFRRALCRLKRCLYDGLRTRLLRWTGSQYETPRGVAVATPSLYTDAMENRVRSLRMLDELPRPAWILTDSVQLRPVRGKERSMLYAVSAGNISVLDGFVAPDPDFAAPRIVPPT